MREINETMTAATRVLKKKTLKVLLGDDRVTDHGLYIVERWCQEEPTVIRHLERTLEKFMTVLLGQQEWASPFTYETNDWQLKNGLTAHEIREMGARDLSCRYAVKRLSL